MNFHGLIVTDAMDMAGVRGTSPGRAAVMAVRAGVDILLMTTGEENAARSLKEAVRKGELTVARINSSVRKILAPKNGSGCSMTASWTRPDRRPCRNSGALVAGTAGPRDAVTIVKNEQRVIPLRAFGRKHILSLLISDVEDSRNEINRQYNPLANEQFGTCLRISCSGEEYASRRSGSPPPAIKWISTKPCGRSKSRTCLVSLFMKVRSASGQIGLPQEYRQFVRHSAPFASRWSRSPSGIRTSSASSAGSGAALRLWRCRSKQRGRCRCAFRRVPGQWNGAGRHSGRVPLRRWSQGRADRIGPGRKNTGRVFAGTTSRRRSADRLCHRRLRVSRSSTRDPPRHSSFRRPGVRKVYIRPGGPACRPLHAVRSCFADQGLRHNRSGHEVVR